ncbi:MAG: AMP-binding protein [Rhodospirillaceae bacterium]|jgi:fatty-acyl-CoA synthase|nr:AMP-binding protein [Rhodospirillaceae bacterium]
MMPIDHFFRAASLWPERTAIEAEIKPALKPQGGDGGAIFRLNYAELAHRVNALAAAFQAIDPEPQSRVGICAYNSVEHLVAWLATFAADKVWVPLNPRNGKDELNRIIGVTEPTIAVIDGDCLDKIDPGDATTVLGKPVAGGFDGPGLWDLIDLHDGEAPVRHDLAPDDLQAIKFTGGSSGVPKGVMQTYRVWNTCIASMVASFEFDADDRHLLAAPMTHGANTLIMPIFAKGGVQLFMGKSNPVAIMDAIERMRATSLFVPPTVIYMMMADESFESRDFSSLRHFIAGGAAMRPDAVAKAMPMLNNALETCYGQTEAPQIAICMRAADWLDPRYQTSTGVATTLTRVACMSPDGEVLAPGETGEIVLKGDLVMKGYYKMPDKTAETIIDGWLHTGDIGVIDERGYIFIKDRIRDVVVTGGFNVYPNDVEAVLGQHPAVKECVVFGLPDDKWGEAVHAAVEVHTGGITGGSVGEQEIIEFVKSRLDSVKAPKRVHIVDELPRSPVGKVLRREAKTLFAET